MHGAECGNFVQSAWCVTDWGEIWLFVDVPSHAKCYLIWSILGMKTVKIGDFLNKCFPHNKNQVTYLIPDEICSLHVHWLWTVIRAYTMHIRAYTMHDFPMLGFRLILGMLYTVFHSKHRWFVGRAITCRLSITGGHIDSSELGVQESTPSRDDSSSFNARLDARAPLLRMLPQILSSLRILWKAVSDSEARYDSHSGTQSTAGTPSWWTLGTPKVLTHHL